jgi:hypothetical protein
MAGKPCTCGAEERPPCRWCGSTRGCNHIEGVAAKVADDSEPQIRVDEVGRVLATCPKCREHHTLIPECANPECGAPLSPSDVSADGKCRYCGMDSGFPLPGQGEDGGVGLPSDEEIPRMGRDRLIAVIQNVRKMLHGE